MNPSPSPRASHPVRCAIYTRKSTEEGLDQEFNSLDAQREAGEAYIHSQASAGWVCLKTQYNDGGFTGGTMDRPALTHLLADIRARKIDCVVTYKVDRLSRSLLDFARMMDAFEQHQVSFVSVTQQFNTATSMGRLVLNVLLSFAQFERDIIAERTRDKIAAARRKGKWSGGIPVLGYDVDPQGPRLVVNEEEALQVRAIFALYREHQGLLPVVEELARRGWTTKRWLTRKGTSRGGAAFTKTSLHRLLRNVVYVGQVAHHGEIYRGQHTAIVDKALWKKVQALSRRQGRARNRKGRTTSGAPLKGLARCKGCGYALTPTHAGRGGKRYRYYSCLSALKRGRRVCGARSVRALDLENVVWEQVCQWARKSPDGTLANLPSWEALTMAEQAEWLGRMVQEVIYDARRGKVRITLRDQEEGAVKKSRDQAS